MEGKDGKMRREEWERDEKIEMDDQINRERMRNRKEKGKGKGVRVRVGVGMEWE